MTPIAALKNWLLDCQIIFEHRILAKKRRVFSSFSFLFFYSETAEVERRRPAETQRGGGDLFEVLCVFRYDQYFLSSRRLQKYEENIEKGFACETSNSVHDHAHNTFLQTYFCLLVS